MALYEHIAADISILHFNKYCFVLFNRLSTSINVLVTPSSLLGIRIWFNILESNESFWISSMELSFDLSTKTMAFTKAKAF